MARPETRSNVQAPKKADQAATQGKTKDKKKSEALSKKLEAVEERWEKADPEHKATIESQLKKNGEAAEPMNVDSTAESDNRAETHQNGGSQETRTHDDGDAAGQQDGGPMDLVKRSHEDNANNGNVPESDDEEIGLINALEDMTLDDGELEHVYRGGFGHWYGIYRHGQGKFLQYKRRFLCYRGEDPPKPDPKYDYKSLVQDKKVGKGDARRITGAVWETCGTYGHMESLAPSNWPTERDSSRRHAPEFRVKVMWHDKDDGPESWETRSDAKKYMYRKNPKPAEYRAKESVKWGNLHIINEGDTVHPADLMIIKTAVRLEERYQKRLGKEDTAGRDPTPGLLRSGHTPEPKKEEGGEGQ